MPTEDRARVALAIVVAVIGAIAITKAGIDPRDGLIRWLVFSLAAGLVINNQEGKSVLFLLVASALTGLGLVATLVWLALLRDGVIPALSGITVDFVRRPLYGGLLLGGVWVGSIGSVLVCSLSRPFTLSLLRDALSVDLARARRVEKLLRLFFAIGSAAGLLVYSIL